MENIGENENQPESDNAPQLGDKHDEQPPEDDASGAERQVSFEGNCAIYP